MLNIRMRGDAGARKSARRNAKAAQPRGFQQCILPADQWVPLVGNALEIIQRQPRGNRDEVFPFGESLLSKYWLEACRALSIPDLHWHDLRHEAASRLIEAGWSAHEVRVVTGHASSQHLDRYVNLDPADVARKAVK